MDTNLILIAAALGILLSVVVTYLLVQRKSDRQAGELATLSERLQGREAEIQQLQAEVRRLEDDGATASQSNTQLREQAVRLQADLANERRTFEEKLTLLESAREQMTLQFKELANEILEDKSKRFTASNQENISQLLKPLQEKIVNFEKRVEETYDRESKDRFSLTKEIRNLQELNKRISEDAINLTNALKGDNKAQGTWGEVILESILEKSGLVKGREYEVQVNMKGSEGGRAQPDVIVHLPEERDIVIDAKVSLKAYEAYHSEAGEERKREFLRQHVQSLRSHVKLLASKEYQSLAGVNSLDFILLFMPVEAAFAVAVQEDNGLFLDAFDRNIIIVGPSTLLATLRAVQNIWRMAKQNKNAVEIADQAGKLYDKFVLFTDDLQDIGAKLEATNRSYMNAHNKLASGRGNLVSRIDRLKKLGAKASKKMDKELLQSADLEIRKDALPDPDLEGKPKGQETH